MPCCAGSTRCRGGRISWRDICLRASAARWRGARTRRRTETAVCRPAGAGARLHRWRRAASRQTARRRRLFPFRQDGAAPAASRRHLSQRSRQGAELAARQRRPRLCDRLSACRLLQAPQRLFRIAAYEDLRHLLKHKRRYAPEALTPRSARSCLARACRRGSGWRAARGSTTAITRGLFNFTDREGGGLRLIQDAPSIATQLRSFPDVREAADRRIRGPPHRHRALCLRRSRARRVRARADATTSRKASGLGSCPNSSRWCNELPRKPSGEVRTEILQLVAMNQIDLMEPLIANEAERAQVRRIVEDRREPARPRSAGVQGPSD